MQNGSLLGINLIMIDQDHKFLVQVDPATMQVCLDKPLLRTNPSIEPDTIVVAAEGSRRSCR